MEKLLKKHYPDIFILIENAKYNMNQDISGYFGKEIMVIYGGHGGSGFNYRILIGIYKKDKKYYVLGKNSKCGSSLLYMKDWYCNIVLPENFKKFKEYFNDDAYKVPLRPIRLD